MSTSATSDAAAQAAAEAAAAASAAFVVELWTLYATGVAVTVLRTYARLKAVGIKNFRADDYLIWAAIMFYSVQSTLAYSIGNIAHGLANNGMTDAERAALSTSDPEYDMRIIGSKIQVVGWASYSSLICLLKLAMLVFYTRLTEGLGRRYRMRIWIGFGLVIGTFVASIGVVLLSCLPFEKYWQINPDPGDSCQAAISKPIIWTSFASNVITDIYLILIPIPLLWGSTLKLVKKIAATIVLGTGIFVLVCATLKSIFVLVDPVNGAQLAGSWGTREAFVAVFTTNLPLIFPLIKTWLRPIFGSRLGSTQKAYKTPTGFRTIGGGGDFSSRQRHTGGGRSDNPITANVTFTESEERIVHSIKMQDLKGYTSTHPPSNGIVISNEVEVTSEDRASQHGDQKAERTHETW